MSDSDSNELYSDTSSSSSSAEDETTYERCCHCQEEAIMLLREDADTEYYELCMACEQRICYLCLNEANRLYQKIAHRFVSTIGSHAICKGCYDNNKDECAGEKEGKRKETTEERDVKFAKMVDRALGKEEEEPPRPKKQKTEAAAL